MYGYSTIWECIPSKHVHKKKGLSHGQPQHKVNVYLGFRLNLIEQKEQQMH